MKKQRNSNSKLEQNLKAAKQQIEDLKKQIEFITAKEADLMSKLDLNSESRASLSEAPSNAGFLFGKIPPKPEKHPLIPVLDFEKLDEWKQKADLDENDIEVKKKELGSKFPSAKVTGLDKLNLE